MPRLATLGSSSAGSFGSSKKLSFSFLATISSDTTNYNLKTAAITGGWDQVKPLIATVTINSGVYVYSTSTGTYAFDTGSTFPIGSVLNLINNGTILGKGGAGGSGGSGNNGSPGGSGGPALRVQYALTITNNNRIAGGGGGGGGGRGGSNPDKSGPNIYDGGGGGGGIGNGAGGPGGGGTAGSGTLTSAGAGGAGQPGSPGTPGGSGGGYGSAGGGATGSSGGAAGGAIVGVSYVTFSTTGTINGTQTG